MIPAISIFRNSVALVLLWSVQLAPAIAAELPDLQEAIRLYDAGRYAEASPLLERVVATGDADGITHYRLFFCQRVAGDPRQQQTLNLTRTLLERELEKSPGFEVAFYLSNTYANLGLDAEVTRVATAVTSLFEAGDLAPPTSPVEQFRLGKLYADRAGVADAERWFEKAVDGLAASANAAHRPYLEFAARWLGARAIEEERFETAAKHFNHVCAGDTGTLQDFHNLALASLMIGDYDTAVKSSNQALRMNPKDANPYRYMSALANLASLVPNLPISPDEDRGWNELTREELEALLRQHTQTVRGIQTEFKELTRPSQEQRRAFQERISAVKPVFVAAAIEYIRRGLNLREAAFFGGFAPLIFHAREWQAQPNPPIQKRKTLVRRKQPEDPAAPQRKD
jgi:tetratricopeptide (TPR) repeat protein